MKLTLFLLIAACLHLSATGYSQEITISKRKAPVSKIFKEIQNQTNYVFWYYSRNLQKLPPVSMNVKNATIEEVMSICLNGSSLTYSIDGDTITVSPKLVAASGAGQRQLQQQIDLTGKVLNEKSEPIPGASVLIKNSKKGVVTDSSGNFILRDVQLPLVLVVSSIGYRQREKLVQQRGKMITVVLPDSSNTLNEVIIIPYGVAKRRDLTGSIVTVSGKVIQQYPNANPILALQGRAPGLSVTPSNGIPGSSVMGNIRGQNTIGPISGSNNRTQDQPMFIIDGIPLSNSPINQLNSLASLNVVAGPELIGNAAGMSPLNLLNSADIESISIFKDADATSIYGSRGANGVILITTKKGRVGSLRLNIDVNTGASGVPYKMPFMTTKEFLRLRQDAIQNAGRSPDLNSTSPGYAPDLLLFDTNRNINFNKVLLGGLAAVVHAQGELSGGTKNMNFLLGLGFNNAGTPLPGNQSDNKSSLHFNVNHLSEDEKFSFSVSSTWVYDANNLYTGNAVPALTLPPDYPALHDPAGNLVQTYKDYPLQNFYSLQQNTYNARANNWFSHLDLQYRVLPVLSLKIGLGYNTMTNIERELDPEGSMSSATGTTSSSSFANTSVNSWIAEPQVEYKKKLGKGDFGFLLGGTLQNNSTTSITTSGVDYPNNTFISNLSQAHTILRPDIDQTDYKYAATFGRLTYNYDGKYLVSFNGRRDGSSRFGVNRQYGNFGSVSAAWVFSNEKWTQAISFLSFGKIRGSYGTSGNDAVGDYMYLNLYDDNKKRMYLGNETLAPLALSNPDYSWQVNKKSEANLDLAFLEDRISLSVAYYSNTCGNQLVEIPLPGTTGFGSVIANFPGKVRNNGWELVISTQNIKKQQFSWTTTVNISFPKNKLVAFPGLGSSSYKNSNYVIGQPLSNFGGLRFLGVDPQTGLNLFADNKGQPTSSPSPSSDNVPSLGNLEPEYYGGIDNSLTYKNCEASFFFDFRKQTGLNYLSQLAAQQPGIYSTTDQMNFPRAVLNYWKKPGDHADFAQPNVDPGSSAYQSAAILGQNNSSAKYGDASFLRLKNISVSYNLPPGVIKKWHLQKFRIYIQGENLLILTPYKGQNPETQNMLTLPPLRTVTGGISLTF